MSKTLKPDLDQAENFLNLLDPNGVFTFQTFDDRKDQKVSALPMVYHGTLRELQAKLTTHQSYGAGIFVMVNKGDGIAHAGSKTCRTAANVIAVRALFVDLDGAPLAPVLACRCQPDIVVESSPGRYHAYWLTSDCPLSEFTQRQKQLAEKFGGDPSVCDLPRVMRVPGFWHQKSAPFMTQIVYPE